MTYFMKFLKVIFTLFFIFFLFVLLLLVYLQLSKEDVVFNVKEAKNISYSPLIQIVPSNKIPANLKLYRSNNNLDIVKYKDRYFFAFRTSPTHFASDKTMIYILSSSNLKKWEYETQFHLKSDIREPRFLVFKDKLFFYFFQGGVNPLDFEPKGIFVSEYISRLKWTKPKQIYEPGFVVWRVKTFGNKAYMSVYYGVGLYSFDDREKRGRLQLLQSDDGYNWELINNKDVLNDISCEEGEFEFDKEGNLYATVRMEKKGGKVCYASKSDITNWKCKFTQYKYDSAVMFRNKDDFYVVARRNVDGKFNKNSKYLPENWRSKYYLIRYSLTRKRTSLYKLNKEKLELEPLFDFPSKGDTAFAGVTKISENKYLVFNYSSDIHGFDWNWLAGQIVGSNIYSTVVEFK